MDSFVFLIPQGDNSKKTTTTTSSKNNNSKHNPKTEYNSIDDDDDRSSNYFNSCRVDSNRSIFVLFTSLQILLFQFNSYDFGIYFSLMLFFPLSQKLRCLAEALLKIHHTHAQCFQLLLLLLLYLLK